MKKEDRTYIMFLEDILTSMNRIAEYIDGYDFETFRRDYKTVDAVIRNFEVLGEASKNIPLEIKQKYPHIPWNEMYLLRNKVSHEYFGVDYEIIWDVASNYLPENRTQIEEIFLLEK
ncbi:MAG: DUF86 domain-containing protein [Bacteroidales bacterium]|nr:DUF86 domain-containing protein [Bacteroidales bacterium]